jgi:sugar phosphate isomerase/epimerase
MNRREFVAAMTAAGMVGPMTACAGDKAAARPAVGVQLYTVRGLMAESVESTLQLVAEIGYPNVEFAGYFDHSPSEIRRMLDDAGLAAPAAHIGQEYFENDAAAVIDLAAAIGHEYVVIPALPGDRRNSLDYYYETAERFNAWGEACRAAGIRFAYHNHEWEFQDEDGKVFYDVLLDETDPEFVEFELDLAWIHVAGRSAVEYFERYPGRFPLWHVKDMTADNEMVDVGDGVIDFPTIIEHASVGGTRYGFVEHDNPADPAASIRRSYAATKALLSA